MVHKVAGAFALGAALMLSTSAMAQDKRAAEADHSGPSRPRREPREPRHAA